MVSCALLQTSQLIYIYVIKRRERGALRGDALCPPEKGKYTRQFILIRLTSTDASVRHKAGGIFFRYARRILLKHIRSRSVSTGRQRESELWKVPCFMRWKKKNLLFPLIRDVWISLIHSWNWRELTNAGICATLTRSLSENSRIFPLGGPCDLSQRRWYLYHLSFIVTCKTRMNLSSLSSNHLQAKSTDAPTRT